jgi:hypothetical protein
MKPFLLVAIVTAAMSFSACSQSVLLNPGQSYVFSFEPGSLPPPRPSPYDNYVAGGFGLDPNHGNSCNFRFEMFENSADESPILAWETEAHEDCSLNPGVTNAWQDLQGVVRVTAITPTLLSFMEIEITVPSTNGFLYYDGYILPRPGLNITPADGGQLQITWPTNFIGYSLESALTLSASTWAPIINSAAIVRDQFSVTLRTGEARQFFRLRAN